MLVVDWEMAQLGVLPLDLGQMLAEMYLLKLCKGIEAALQAVRGFLTGYGEMTEDFTFRTLLHLGTHIVWIIAGVTAWGDGEETHRAMAVGRDIILRAWDKDKAWFIAGDLSCFFSNA